MTDYNTKLYISNFDSETNESDLRELFEHYGEILHIEMLENYMAAYVTFLKEADAELAMKSLFHLDFLGTELIIKKIDPSGRRNIDKAS